MKFIQSWTLALSACIALVIGALPVRAEGPAFKVDPAWPKPLPNNWILGQVGGLAVDAQDNVWVFQRPRSLTKDEAAASFNPPRSRCCVPAPSVLVYNQAGDIINSWGGPNDARGADWPASEHGLLVDSKGFVWLGGSGKGDGHIMKFTQDGKLVKQFGKPGPLTNSLDKTRFGQVADFDEDPAANEIYIADGYGFHRVVVIDADSGEVKRMWGAYGKPPTDENLPPYNAEVAAVRQSGALHPRSPMTASSTSATAPTTASRSSRRMARSCSSSCSMPRRKAPARPGASRSRRSTRTRIISS